MAQTKTTNGAVTVRRLLTLADMASYAKRRPTCRFLGVRSFWRIQGPDQFRQNPETGTMVYAVPDNTAESMDALCDMLLNAPCMQNIRARVSGDVGAITTLRNSWYDADKLLPDVRNMLARNGLRVTGSKLLARVPVKTPAKPKAAAKATDNGKAKGAVKRTSPKQEKPQQPALTADTMSALPAPEKADTNGNANAA